MTHYPRFKEWRTKLWEISRELDKREQELVETLMLENKQIEVKLSGADIKIDIPGEWDHGVMVLRPYYTLYKPEFNDLLEIIKERANSLMESFDTYAEALASEELPRTVVARMKGSMEDTSSTAMLRNMCIRKGREILEIAVNIQKGLKWPECKSDMVYSLQVAFPGEAASRLMVEPNQEFFYQLSGRLRVMNQRDECSFEPSEAIKFLGNFPTLKNQADEFQRLITEAFGSWKKSE